jgi:ribonuclease BN (tRNA processing enzyme)
MRLMVLGGCGAWPEPGKACSGFLVEHDGFRLVIDLGYATVPRLLERATAREIDAVFISHGHPDHCADLNPLLRACVPDEFQQPAAKSVVVFAAEFGQEFADVFVRVIAAGRSGPPAVVDHGAG